MADWKDLRRHPLSAEYEDIVGPAWYRFTLKMKRSGFLPGHPIMLHEGVANKRPLSDRQRRFFAARASAGGAMGPIKNAKRGKRPKAARTSPR